MEIPKASLRLSSLAYQTQRSEDAHLVDGDELQWQSDYSSASDASEESDFMSKPVELLDMPQDVLTVIFSHLKRDNVLLLDQVSRSFNPAMNTVLDMRKYTVSKIVAASKLTEGVIAQFKNIRNLDLHVVGATDESMTLIGQLPNLRRLTVSDSSVSDVGLKHVESLTLLSALYVAKTKVTNAGLTSLAKLVRLEVLNLSDTQVTDEGVADLVVLGRLKHLNLYKTKVTNAVGPHIAKFGRLEWLDLQDTQVTDALLPHVVNLGQLDRLFLSDTEVTVGGMEDLKKQLPELHVVHRTSGPVKLPG